MIPRQGNEEAIRQVVTCYLYEIGKGVNKDYVKMLELYEKAAKQGNIASIYSLATCYHESKGLRRDDQEAVAWLEKIVKDSTPSSASTLLKKITGK